MRSGGENFVQDMSLRRQPLGMLRVQLLAVFLAQAIPAGLYILFVQGQTALADAFSQHTLYGQTTLFFGLAAIASLITIRQLSAFPGAVGALYIMPSIVLAYGTFALIAFAFRIEYIRPIVIASFTGCVVWLYADYLVRQRNRLPRISLVPGGNLRNFEATTRAKVTALRTPLDHMSDVDVVAADLHHDHDAIWDRYLARCVLAGIPVHDVKSLQELMTGRVDIQHLSENGFGAVLPSNLYLKIKRLADLVAALVLLPPFLLVIGVAALFIRLESKGSAIFTQQRTGFRGKPFTIYKLRSMRMTEAGTAFTKEGDSRITTVGKFIRTYRIDEMPQIFNIIKGDMSWIGPRPEAEELAQWYESEIPFYVYRHAVRPGLSGWAQVNQGNVAEIEAATMKLQYDFYYIKNFSPWLDGLIVLKTIRTILVGFGSR